MLDWNLPFRSLGCALLLFLSFSARAAKCTYSLAPAGANYTCAATNGTLTMTAGADCPWAATTSNSWLHTTSAGSGNGTILYTLDANASPSGRTGLIIAGGQSCTISQAGVPPTLGWALNATNFTWETGADYPWSAVLPSSPTADGQGAAASGNRFVPNSTSWLQTTVVGPGTVTFWWKVDSDVTLPSYDALQFVLNDVVQDEIMGQIDWNYRSFAVPDGTNVLRWQYVKDAQYNSGWDQAWLDQVSFNAAPPLPLPVALNTCGVDWSSGGNDNPTLWSGETAVSQDGQSAAQSGAIYIGQESWLETVVSGVTNLSFWWKVSSQANYDYLQFYTNGVLARQISGEVDWQSNFYRLAPIMTTLRWRFIKTNMTVVAQGQNSAWLDQVVFSPPLPPRILSYPTNVVLSASPTSCQGLLPDLTSPEILVTENCGSIAVSQTPAPGTLLPLGVSQVVLTATGPSGASSSVTSTILVSDTTPPLIALAGPNPLTNECHASFTDPGITAADECSGISSLTTNGVVNPDAVGVYGLEYVATDEAGNAATNTRTVYVVDTQPPVITLNGPNPMTVECHGAFEDPRATALDACAGPVSVLGTHSVNPNAVGVYTIQYIASDTAGNSATNTRTVYVVDTQPPVIALNGASSMTVECHSTFEDPGAGALDACAGPVAIVVGGRVDTNSPGVYTLTYTASDGVNSTNLTRTVNVVDTTPPQITRAVPDQVLTADTNGTAVLPDFTALLEASDACSSAVRVRQVPAPASPLTTGTNTILFLVDDGQGNTNQCSATLIVQVALIAPIVSVPEPPVDGQFRFSFSGPSGQTYRVLASTDLTAPLADWIVLTNGTFGAVPVAFIDTTALPQRFYRLTSP